MDELTIDGKVYVSSKRAATITGYAKDYIGQLCREGRVEAKLVGRSWYVYEPSLKKHRFSDEEAPIDTPKAETAWGGIPVTNDSEKEEETSEKTNIQAVWGVPAYSPEEVIPLPELEPEPAVTTPEPEALTDMQSAWQEWFSTRPQTPTEGKNTEESLPEEEPVTFEASKEATGEESVPLRMIVSDIQPVREERKVESIETPIKPLKKRRKQKGYRILKTILIIVIVVATSATLVSIGVIEALHLGSTSGIGPIEYLQGSVLVEK